MKNHEIIINEYSLYKTKDYFVRDENDQIVNVFDKLIELAARKCDRYASDVFWDMRTLNEYIEKEEKFDRLLFFREMGVHSVDVQNFKEYLLYDAQRLSEEPCVWRLEHKLEFDEICNPIWITTLTRVRIKIKLLSEEGENND